MKLKRAIVLGVVVGAALWPAITGAQVRPVARVSGIFDPNAVVGGGGAAIGPDTIVLHPYVMAGGSGWGPAVLGGGEIWLRVARTSDRTWLYVGVGSDGALTRHRPRQGTEWQVGGNVLGLVGVRAKNGYFAQVAVSHRTSAADPRVIVSVGKIFSRR